MSFQISLNSIFSEIHCQYHEGISLGNRQYEVGLKSFVTYNNIPNISEENNKLVFIEKINAINSVGTYEKQHVLRIPKGTYEIQDLVILIEKAYPDSKTKISLNKNILKMEVYSEWIIDFSCANSIGPVLGFSNRRLPSDTLHYSDLPINIFPINTIRIRCNLINCNIQGSERNDNTLYEFPLNTSLGERIIERPINISYYRVITETIHDLVLRICDQDGHLVDFRGEKISITLDFRAVK